MQGKDPYQTLGVSKDAEQDAIKKAYKKLARKYHPDLNKNNPAAEEKFKEVSQAFEILGNPERRKLYDEFGEISMKPGFDAEQARQYRQWSSGGRGRGGGGGGFNPFTSGRSARGFDGEGFSDLFGSIFGGGRTGTRRRAVERGGDIESELTIDMTTALKGEEVEITIDLPVSCSQCGGSGTAGTGGGGGVCPECGGSGAVHSSQGFFDMQTPCSRCSGTGSLPGPVCPTCRGSTMVKEPTKLKVRIPAGVNDGSKIRLAGKGRPGKNGGPSGDLHLKIKLRPHPILRREGDDLLMTLPVTLEEAVSGATIDVPTLSGSVKLKIPPGSQSGQKLRLRGKGAVVRGGKKGDLYVELHIKIPENKSRELKDLAEKISRFYKGDVRKDIQV